MKIMAPAGDPDRFLAALKAGADEIYMGIAGFGARQFAKNFSLEEYLHSLDEAHRYGVTVHLTLNTLLSDAEMDSVLPDVERLRTAGLDGVIVQDIGVFQRLREAMPDLPVTASTQMSCSTVREAAFLAKAGFSRIVLARELSFDEIEKIRRATRLELEVFVAGALCLGASGKCYLSSFIGGRSGNRGCCAQPCRHRYSLTETDRGLLSFPQKGYYLSLRDQWQELPDLVRLGEIGVDSLKIEGRMKSPVYVYEAVRYYRGLVDTINEQKGEKQTIRRVIKDMPPDDHLPCRITSLFNRGQAKGYLTEHDPKMINEKFSSNFGTEIGRVEGRWIRLSAPIRLGDGIVYLDNQLEKISGSNVNRVELLDERSRRSSSVQEAPVGSLVGFENFPPPDAVYVYRTFDHQLNRELTHRIEQTSRHAGIEVDLKAKTGLPLTLTLTHSRASAASQSEAPLDRARKAADTTVLAETLDRFGDSPFFPLTCHIEADPDVFVPKSVLNRVRQTATQELEKALISSYQRKPTAADRLRSRTGSVAKEPFAEIPVLAVCVRTEEQRKLCEQAGIPVIYTPTFPLAVNQPATSISSLPLAGNFDDASRYEQEGISYATDWTFNIGNSRAILFMTTHFPHLTTIYLSPEISEQACFEAISEYRANPKSRFVRFGLPVYGHLPALFTRKTLFETKIAHLQDDQQHFLSVTRNSDWYPNGKEMTGSTIYYAAALDLLASLPQLGRLGIGEARLDLSVERPEEIQELLRQGQTLGAGRQNTWSYGFERGIF